MTRGYLVVDIETVPDRDLPWDPERGFPPATHHQVVALGALWLEEDLSFRRMGVFGDSETPEAQLLGDFTRFVGHRHPHIVTFNGRSFDMPVLANRCLRHGVSFGLYYADRDYRYRYSDHGHIDLAEVLTDHGAARRPTLDGVARLIGMPGKLEVDGSKVESLFADGRLEEIRRYCLQDVIQTAFVFVRVELLRGRIDRDGYRRVATALWDAVSADERAGSLFAAADRARVLLEDG